MKCKTEKQTQNTKRKTKTKHKTIVVEQKNNDNIFLKGEQAAKISKQVCTEK